MRGSTRKKMLAALFITCVLIDPIMGRRSGGSHSRGASSGRSGGGFGAPRNRGGTSGGGGYHHNSGSNYPRGNYGIGGSHSNTGGGMFSSGNNRQSNSGGWFGNNRKSNTGGGGFFKSSSHHNPKFNKGSGIGSMVRSNSFKNAIVGAAAGYLTYQAGKHLIRSAMSPMMWGGRPYYWGSNYYQQRPGYSMCRMPIDSSDSQFGNIYFQDQTRPREITWGCGYSEVCCGYECCPASHYGGGYGGGSGYGGGFFRNSSYRGFQFGSLMVLLMISCCACFLMYRICQRNPNTYQRASAY